VTKFFKVISNKFIKVKENVAKLKQLNLLILMVLLMLVKEEMMIKELMMIIVKRMDILN